MKPRLLRKLEQAGGAACLSFGIRVEAAFDGGLMQEVRETGSGLISGVFDCSCDLQRLA
jgi:hypothetical protein